MIINGYEISVHRISNYLLYEKIIRSDKINSLVYPEIPKKWDEKRKGWLENPMHPDYLRDIDLYEIAKNNIIIDLLLNDIVEIDMATIDPKLINRLQRTRLTDNLKLGVLKHIVLQNSHDINQIIYSTLLTEALVYQYIGLISITRNGVDILQHGLKNPADAHIEISPITVGAYELVSPLHEYTACIEAKLDWNSWLNNGYELNVMAYTIAIHRLNKLIDIHSQDEIQSQQSKGKK